MTHPMLRAGARRLLTAVALTFAPAALAAQALPPAADLMAAYTAAIGGETAFKKITSMHTTGSFSMPAMGVTGQLSIWNARPSRVLLVINLPGLGEMRQGFDGTTAWSIDPMQGARVLSGNELKAAQDEAGFETSIRLISNFQSAETVEKTTMGGQECYKVKLVWKSGRETYDCYSTTDGLLVGQVSIQESPMGTLEAVTTVSDYRQFGDVRIPTRTVVSVAGMEQVITIDKVEFTPIEDSRFELPPEVKALISK